MTAGTADARADELARRANEVLDRNRRGDWTCPAAGIYPHQWLWDSCFVAIGLARVDPRRAASELRALLRGQWTNGMLPHVVFAPGVRDAGSRRLWQSARDPRAPRTVATSCITQPPLPALAARHVADALRPDDARAFLAGVVPAIVRYHEWLYRERDVRGDGFVALLHPWECGLDTTPSWMTLLARWGGPWYVRATLRLGLTHVVRFFRTDTRYLPAAQRARDDDGLRMLALARVAKRHGFDARRIAAARDGLLVEDLAFNALLVVANECLRDLCARLGTPLDGDLARDATRTDAALEMLWDDTRGRYCSRDALTGELLDAATIAALLPLACDVPSARVERLVSLLKAPGFAPRHPVPSVPTDAPGFDPERYWQGPTWVNTNWILVRALDRHGEHARARQLARQTLDLVAAHGFAEYFSPLTGEGFGAAGFSWTAALVLDLLAVV
ncbi:MAG TPA: trehalase family glycosidase [Acidimicrobiia bacterium]|nr:trehalase family glycosidase [Acidimicrobiia bacterium]